MFISRYANKYFEPNDNDDKNTATMKKYYRDKDRIGREMLQKYEQQKENEKNIEEFNIKYEQLKRMKSKTPLEQLEREYVINELLNEYK
jgi:aminoglycoside N3'-acetyltransferase